MVNFNEITEQWEADGIPTKRTEQDLLTDIVRLLEYIGQMLRIAVSVLVAIAIAIVMAAVARADEIETVPAAEVQPVADMVASWLRDKGFKATSDHLPPVVLVALYNGRSGETNGRLIRVDARAPDACRTKIVAHELLHVILFRSNGAVAGDEALARQVEDVVDPDYKPGCDRAQRGPVFPLGEFTL